LFIGAVGAFAFAAPASATNNDISVAGECEPKTRTAALVWTVKNARNSEATVVAVDRTLEGLVVGTKIPARGTVTGTEKFEIGKTEFVDLSVTIGWLRGSQPTTLTERIDLTKLDCSPKPVAEFADRCDQTTVVTVTAGRAGTYIVNGYEKFRARKELAEGETWEVTVPADNSRHVRVKLDHEVFTDHKWTAPENCFEVTSTSTCDDLSITVKNTGTTPLKATIKAGDAEETTEIAAGQSGTTTLAGVEGLVVTLTVNKTVSEITWTEPADCDTTLPVTGVNAGLLAGAALVLLAGGGGLFYLARRRRIRFAA
jgi:LPXTG-motif cell wall-anchored protein